jgi:hypothetical protein
MSEKFLWHSCGKLRRLCRFAGFVGFANLLPSMDALGATFTAEVGGREVGVFKKLLQCCLVMVFQSPHHSAHGANRNCFAGANLRLPFTDLVLEQIEMPAEPCSVLAGATS